MNSNIKPMGSNFNMSAKDALIERLQANHNFISIRDFMTFCLMDPDYGYYSTKPSILGRGGDFVTAPEISQIFGELIGLWFLNHWEQSQDSKDQEIALLELGPGRGLLMRDILRTCKVRPQFLENLSVHMVEINDNHKKDQQEKCAPNPITHHDSLETALQSIGNKRTYVIANEFFDALPLDQYIYKDQKWQTRGVCYDPEKDEFLFSSAPLDFADSNVPFPMKPDEGTIMESSPVTESLFRQLTTHIQQVGGASLIIDYGYDAFGFGDTLQALKDHKKVSPLSHITDADLTTHVNFATLKRIASIKEKDGLFCHLGTQGNFLRNLGIDIRTELLGKACKTVSERDDLFAATNRLVDPSHMGDLFKCLQIWTQPL